MPVVTARISEKVNDEIEEVLDYNDTKSDWIREAVEEKLEREGVMHGRDEQTPST